MCNTNQQINTFEFGCDALVSGMKWVKDGEESTTISWRGVTNGSFVATKRNEMKETITEKGPQCCCRESQQKKIERARE